MHTALLSSSNSKVSINIFINLLSEKISIFLEIFTKKLYSTVELLEVNSFFYSRVKNIGIISSIFSSFYGLSGVLLRSLGQKIDLRKKKQFDMYHKISFSVPVKKSGDTFDRLYIRIEEMFQSLKIIASLLNFIEIYKNTRGKKQFNTSKNISMESIISKFKYEGYFSKNISSYITAILNIAVEAPKGETNINLEPNKKLLDNSILRLYIKAPGFVHCNSYLEFLMATL